MILKPIPKKYQKLIEEAYEKGRRNALEKMGYKDHKCNKCGAIRTFKEGSVSADWCLQCHFKPLGV